MYNETRGLVYKAVMHNQESEMDVYQQEIDELTSLMRKEWIDVKQCISRAGLNPETTLLVSFSEDEDEDEDEDEMEFTILVTEDKRVFECSRSTAQGSEIKFASITELPINEATFALTPAIQLAVSR